MQKQKPVTDKKPEVAKLVDDTKLKEALKEVSKDNFLSAKELGLSDLQYRGLVMTLRGMESGTVVHYKKLDPMNLSAGIHPFRMENWRRPWGSCGTVACIGGTAEIMVGVGRWGLFTDPIHRQKGELGNLLFRFPDCVTEVEAAKALRGYLETGKTDWKESMK